MWYSYWCNESRERVRKKEFPLHTAAAGNDSEKLKILLAMKEDEICRGQRTSGSELRQKHRGVCKRHIEEGSLAALLRRGGGRCSYCLDQYNPDGFTPLHCAAYNGNPECVELLLKAGAYFNPRNKDDNTPIQIAEIRVIPNVWSCCKKRWTAESRCMYCDCALRSGGEVAPAKVLKSVRKLRSGRMPIHLLINMKGTLTIGGGTPYTDPSQPAHRHHYQQEIFAVQRQQHYNRTGAYV